ADLSCANLSCANLIRADLSCANLSDIRWDNHTKWSNVTGLEEAKNVPEAWKQ
ncbi:pentapeptide repeats family protein, partial [Lyngbya aestuarii BL J]